MISLLFLATACKEKKHPGLNAQEIVDRSIEAAGGDRYGRSAVSFVFRGRTYTMESYSGRRLLKRITVTDTAVVTDIKEGNEFRRLMNDSLVQVPDTMAVKYANSVNSVHYFAYLPYGLNDKAVNKELLGEATLDGKSYYKIRVTFDRLGGGSDYEDVFIYWINKETFAVDFLAYEYHTDGGGIRFREAYNERYVNGIRFADHHNYQAETGTDLLQLDSLFLTGSLTWLSDIELEDIRVSPGNYN